MIKEGQKTRVGKLFVMSERVAGEKRNFIIVIINLKRMIKKCLPFISDHVKDTFRTSVYH